jgi:hypothetical protein
MMEKSSRNCIQLDNKEFIAVLNLGILKPASPKTRNAAVELCQIGG